MINRIIFINNVKVNGFSRYEFILTIFINDRDVDIKNIYHLFKLYELKLKVDKVLHQIPIGRRTSILNINKYNCSINNEHIHDLRDVRQLINNHFRCSDPEIRKIIFKQSIINFEYILLNISNIGAIL